MLFELFVFFATQGRQARVGFRRVVASSWRRGCRRKAAVISEGSVRANSARRDSGQPLRQLMQEQPDVGDQADRL